MPSHRSGDHGKKTESASSSQYSPSTVGMNFHGIETTNKRKLFDIEKGQITLRKPIVFVILFSLEPIWLLSLHRSFVDQIYLPQYDTWTSL